MPSISASHEAENRLSLANDLWPNAFRPRQNRPSINRGIGAGQGPGGRWGNRKEMQNEESPSGGT